MQTSFFFRFHVEGDPDPRLVSIASWGPPWYKGRCYKALAPRKAMLKMDEATYREHFQKILDKLDPAKVAADLGPNAILLCWEPPGKFCHRRLVAAWLEEHLGKPILEIGDNERQGNLFLEGREA